MPLQPFEWKDRPSLIEHLFPVQKLSVESYKEQMAGAGKTLTALGSYWKGRKPLILNKACILGSLLPVSTAPLRDLEIFEMLMGMDCQSMEKRIGASLPASKREKISEYLKTPYYNQVRQAKRPEEISDALYSHVWTTVNEHLGTNAHSFPELVEQIGIARFGRRPRIADVFSGSGQIPFEAARLGCDAYASDINPIACMLTWGAFNIVGANEKRRINILNTQRLLSEKVQSIIDALGVESDGHGWKAKVYFYCVEVDCPESGWKVPILPTRIISKGYRILARLVPNHAEKRYEIQITKASSDDQMEEAKNGTIRDGEIVHSPDGTHIYRVKIVAIRGDHKDGHENKNALRMWDKSDYIPHSDDVFQERLYCIQWMKKKTTGKGDEYQFRSVTSDDIKREQKVIEYIGNNLPEWQEMGYIPDMRIEKGVETERLYRERGWTHWHHLFNPRHLLTLGLIKKEITEPSLYVSFASILDFSSKLSRWTTSGTRIAKDGSGQQIGGASNNTTNVFYNQALNTLYNWGCRSLSDQLLVLDKPVKHYPIAGETSVTSLPGNEVPINNDIYITDPPYGDAVKYEEITEFFIAWLRKNPPSEFAHWTWDSRRSLAIKGEDEGFRQGMVSAYRNMMEMMPDNGIQVLMFTHQSGTIWADMANIIWASGLQVTAAWYVVTESDSAIRQGANVTGTVLLVLRKRQKHLETFRDDLAWEIEDAVQAQVESLLGLDRSVRAQKSEGLYSDADLQMAGYAAALKVLTSYSVIDGKDMTFEAESPRQKGKKTFVDDLIDFAVQTAVQFLVPVGFESGEWQNLQPVERFYLKMADMESQGCKTLDNYQNFAKAFKVSHFDQLTSDSTKANSARLKLASEFKGSMMSGDAELAGTPLRALLYAIFEYTKNEAEIDDILLHLMDNCPNYLPNRLLLVKLASYLADKRDALEGTKLFHPDEEASAARVLAEAIRVQRL